MPASASSAPSRSTGTKRVRSPAKGISRLTAERTDHPYALLGGELVAESLGWFTRTAAAGPYEGYGYVGGIERNLLLPTALGALKPSALVPNTFAAGDSAGLQRVCIVGSPALRDFHPGLCAANLIAAGIEARAVTLDLPVERADVSAVGIDMKAGAIGIPSDIHRVGWWRDGAAPGDKTGTVLIAGHVDSKKAGAGAFFALKSARSGDT